MRSERKPRGFTLIELMLAVAIVGVLSSVAIPEYLRVTHRARLAEREPILSSVARAVEDVTLAGQTPPPGAYNPDASPGSVKRIWAQTQPGWVSLPLVIQGAVYCSYRYFFVPPPSGTGSRLLFVVGSCDIDGDGNPNTKINIYEDRGESFVFRSDLSTGSDDDGTF